MTSTSYGSIDLCFSEATNNSTSKLSAAVAIDSENLLLGFDDGKLQVINGLNPNRSTLGTWTREEWDFAYSQQQWQAKQAAATKKHAKEDKDKDTDKDKNKTNAYGYETVETPSATSQQQKTLWILPDRVTPCRSVAEANQNLYFAIRMLHCKSESDLPTEQFRVELVIFNQTSLLCIPMTGLLSSLISKVPDTDMLKHLVCGTWLPASSESPSPSSAPITPSSAPSPRQKVSTIVRSIMMVFPDSNTYMLSFALQMGPVREYFAWKRLEKAGRSLAVKAVSNIASMHFGMGASGLYTTDEICTRLDLGFDDGQILAIHVERLGSRHELIILVTQTCVRHGVWTINKPGSNAVTTSRTLFRDVPDFENLIAWRPAPLQDILVRDFEDISDEDDNESIVDRNDSSTRYSNLWMERTASKRIYNPANLKWFAHISTDGRRTISWLTPYGAIFLQVGVQRKQTDFQTNIHFSNSIMKNLALKEKQQGFPAMISFKHSRLVTCIGGIYLAAYLIQGCHLAIVQVHTGNVLLSVDLSVMVPKSSSTANSTYSLIPNSDDLAQLPDPNEQRPSVACYIVDSQTRKVYALVIDNVPVLAQESIRLALTARRFDAAMEMSQLCGPKLLREQLNQIQLVQAEDAFRSGDVFRAAALWAKSKSTSSVMTENILVRLLSFPSSSLGQLAAADFLTRRLDDMVPETQYVSQRTIISTLVVHLVASNMNLGNRDSDEQAKKAEDLMNFLMDHKEEIDHEAAVESLLYYGWRALAEEFASKLVSHYSMLSSVSVSHDPKHKALLKKSLMSQYSRRMLSTPIPAGAVMNRLSQSSSSFALRLIADIVCSNKDRNDDSSVQRIEFAVQLLGKLAPRAALELPDELFSEWQDIVSIIHDIKSKVVLNRASMLRLSSNILSDLIRVLSFCSDPEIQARASSCVDQWIPTLRDDPTGFWNPLIQSYKGALLSLNDKTDEAARKRFAKDICRIEIMLAAFRGEDITPLVRERLSTISGSLVNYAKDEDNTSLWEDEALRAYLLYCSTLLGNATAVSEVYASMGWSRDAVFEALRLDDLDLAQKLAKSAPQSGRFLAWLMIAQHVALKTQTSDENLAGLMDSVCRSNGVLNVEDILPLLEDSNKALASHAVRTAIFQRVQGQKDAGKGAASRSALLGKAAASIRNDVNRLSCASWPMRYLCGHHKKEESHEEECPYCGPAAISSIDQPFDFGMEAADH